MYCASAHATYSYKQTVVTKDHNVKCTAINTIVQAYATVQQYASYACVHTTQAACCYIIGQHAYSTPADLSTQTAPLCILHASAGPYKLRLFYSSRQLVQWQLPLGGSAPPAAEQRKLISNIRLHADDSSSTNRHEACRQKAKVGKGQHTHQARILWYAGSNKPYS